MAKLLGRFSSLRYDFSVFNAKWISIACHVVVGLVAIQFLIACPAEGFQLQASSWSRYLKKPEFQVTEMPDARWFPIPDVDADGRDECFGYQSEVYFVYTDDLVTNRLSCWVKNITTVNPVTSADGSIGEIMVKSSAEEEVRFYRLPLHNGLTDSVALLQCNSPAWVLPIERLNGSLRGDIFPMATADVNRDNIPDIICLVHSNKYALQPRGVCVFDGHDYRPIWHRYFGPWPGNFQFIDLDRNGTPEIVVSGWAVDNGSIGENIADTACYLFAYDLSGKDFWRPIKVGGPLTYCQFKFLPGPDGANFLIVASQSHQTKTAGAILKIDAKSGTLVKQLDRFPGFGSLLVFQGGSRDGRLFAATEDNLVLALDPDLEILHEASRFSGTVKLLALNDFDGDSVPEVFVKCGNDVQLFSYALDSLATIHFNAQVLDFATVNTKGAPGSVFLVSTESHTLRVYAHSEMKSLGEVVPPWAQASLACIIIFTFLFLYMQRRRYLTFLGMVFDDRSRIIMALDSRGRFFRLNDGARRFFASPSPFEEGKSLAQIEPGSAYGPLKAAIELFLRGKQPSAELEIRMIHKDAPHEFIVQLIRLYRGRVFRSTDTIVSMQDITRVSQERLYEGLDAFWRGLAHDLKKPLAPMRLFLQDLGRRSVENSVAVDDINTRYVEPVLTQVDLMTRLINRMPPIPAILAAPSANICISKLLTSLILAKRLVLPKNVALNFANEPPVGSVMGNYEDLERVFLELIDNAITSLENSTDGRINVRLDVETNSPPMVRIEIEDNGPGIASELLARIFEPGVTTGIGDHQGLGLFTARRIVTQHGGRIEVRSKEHVGTIFAVLLPKCEPEAPSD